MEFNASPVVTKQIDGNIYELTQPLSVTYSVDGFECLSFVIPPGYTTDFASVPRIFWSLIPKQGNHSAASILHDYLYSKKTVSRFLADAIFRDVMKRLGVSLVKRVAMYYAVRAFGWFSWRRK